MDLEIRGRAPPPSSTESHPPIIDIPSPISVESDLFRERFRGSRSRSPEVSYASADANVLITEEKAEGRVNGGGVQSGDNEENTSIQRHS